MKETSCPLWDICTDHWRYYSNEKCEMIKAIENKEMPERLVVFMRRQISEYLATRHMRSV